MKITATSSSNVDDLLEADAGANSGQGELTEADYDRMSRTARRVSTERGESFMAAFKEANPGWVPDVSKLA